MKSSITTLAKWVAIASFLLGTVLIAAYYFPGVTELILIGYFYIIAAVLANLALLTILLFKAADSPNRRKILGTAGLMTLNIPIAILYLYFFLVLTNTMRITFINETGETLTQIVVDGCETIELAELEPNERTTCWIDINGDCSITVEYSSKGQTTKEQVFGYATSSMGQKETYRIGKSTEPIDETF